MNPIEYKIKNIIHVKCEIVTGELDNLVRTIDNIFITEMIKQLLSVDKQNRLTIEETKMHPYFWSSETIMKLVENIWTICDAKKKKPIAKDKSIQKDVSSEENNKPEMEELEDKINEETIYEKMSLKWNKSNIDSELFDDLRIKDRAKRTDFSIMELLEIIRNKVIISGRAWKCHFTYFNSFFL